MTAAVIKSMEIFDRKLNLVTDFAKKQIKVIGVTYSPVTGARCPHCNTPKGNVYRTLKWYAGNRLRYHCCRRCGQRFKSVESIEDIKRGYREKALKSKVNP